MAQATPSRTVSDSRVVMTEIVLPEDTNIHGTIFGGRVLALIDKASAIAAIRHCHAQVVTASIDRVDFLAGAHVGTILVLEAALNAAFRTSMEVGVTVLSEDPTSGERRVTCRAIVTQVGVDGQGRAIPVPALELRDGDELLRAQEAAARRDARKGSR